MFIQTSLAGAVLATALATAGFAQSANQMTQDQLTRLTKNGRTLQLGGPDQGYTGELRLNKNGTGKGAVTTDSGKKLTITGSWEVRDGQFCRTWREFNAGKEQCEVWILTTPTTVDVFAGSNKIGVNSW